MKNLIIITLLAFGMTPVLADEKTTELTIVFTNISKKVKGDGYLSLYNDKKTWLKEEKALKSLRIPHDSIKNGTVTVTLSLPQGEYAFSSWFDKDGDGKMDKNFIGIPKEPAGMANNQRPSFGPPKYKKSVFTLGEDPVTQTIKVK
ncbi:DUF2141 domain-containing protein [Temperatibacter marinus]|uniref:DUF2141 domain-containing protein n=1 Tax=Temperatibacter marinus TaxID=1456591 RepID=A0AA52EF18_9PROT|nr:DUF2141 domain-containing protein [Temperatibacter marinus]WND03540.1 DUF2141 domain-containing protein [Temperatibacter marinus]